MGLGAQLAIVVALGLGLGAVLGVVRGFRAPFQTQEVVACINPGGTDRSSGIAVQWVSLDDAKQNHTTAGWVFADARTAEDYRAGHIAGAIHVPMDTGTLPPDTLVRLQSYRTVVAYCDTSQACARSSRLANLLAERGFRDVRVLEGGFQPWLDAGQPAEAGACRSCL